MNQRVYSEYLQLIRERVQDKMENENEREIRKCCKVESYNISDMNIRCNHYAALRFI